MAVKARIKDLAPGAVFNMGPAKALILEHFTNGRTLVVTAESIGDKPFNVFPFKFERQEGFNLNDWRGSTIQKDLNGPFLAAIKTAGIIDTDKIATAEWDLTDHQGGAGYGTSLDKIGLLSQKQFEKYAAQDLLELDDWWWLITPNAGRAHGARSVHSGGSLGSDNAWDGHNGVRPALYLDSEILLSLEPDEVDLSDSALLREFTSRQLVEEVLRRIAAGEESEDDDSDF